MLDGAEKLERRDEGYVEFFTTGTAVEGRFLCAACGYGVVVRALLPRCPMCSGTNWERES